MFISLNSLGSMVLDIYGNRLDALFLDGAGTVQDYFTILKGQDTTPPVILSTDALNPTTVSVFYAEPVDLATAEDPANYAIDNGVTVSQAVLESDGRTVTLTTSALTEGITYTLTVNNVQDLSGNSIELDSQTLFSTTGSASANQPPVASFTTTPPSGEAPLFVDFDATASNDPDGIIVSYGWDYGDSATGSGVVASHEYTTPGFYTVTLTVTDDDGATATATDTVSVGGGTPDIFDPSPGSTLTTPTVTFQWSAGSGVAGYYLGVGTR